ncbi:MAG: hypothetical protein WBV82_24065 [Myxococcaceae bacterium]
MRYELLLQTGDTAVPFDSTTVDAALARRPVTERADGTRLWRVKSGELEVRPLIEAGVPRAMELRVPLGEDPALVREAVVEGAVLATEAGVILYDPQLARIVGPSDEGLVADQYLRTARYAGEMMGVSEALGASFGPVEEGLKPGTKVLLGITAVFVLAWLVLDVLLLG